MNKDVGTTVVWVYESVSALCVESDDHSICHCNTPFVSGYLKWQHRPDATWGGFKQGGAERQGRDSFEDRMKISIYL
jgi:hypothetical protein